MQCSILTSWIPLDLRSRSRVERDPLHARHLDPPVVGQQHTCSATPSPPVTLPRFDLIYKNTCAQNSSLHNENIRRRLSDHRGMSRGRIRSRVFDWDIEKIWVRFSRFANWGSCALVVLLQSLDWESNGRPNYTGGTHQTYVNRFAKWTLQTITSCVGHCIMLWLGAAK